MEAVPLAASTIVADDFYKKVDGLTPAYNALAKWIEGNSYQIVGPPPELFFDSPESGEMTAEIQFPVKKYKHMAKELRGRSPATLFPTSSIRD